ncbi:hypothetical protein [Paracoccus homiensis]|uniref:hypothetical protein n=1 Tax=Paracoccus homiensis TaxID=364199 RepID=UPI00398CBAE5
MAKLTTEAKADLSTRMKELDDERRIVKSQLDRDRLAEITQSLIETITSPEVVSNMKKFRVNAEKTGSFDEAADLMSLETLRNAGAKIPDDFRLTSRVFEDLETGMKVEVRPPNFPVGDIDPLAWGACAGGGAATVCGCAGGSTNLR